MGRNFQILNPYKQISKKENSDLDIIVEFKDVKGLITFISIENELSESLGIKVELLT